MLLSRRILSGVVVTALVFGLVAAPRLLTGAAREARAFTDLEPPLRTNPTVLRTSDAR